MAAPSKFSIELWTPDGRLLADLAGRAKERSLTKSRNQADIISWQLDLNEFERYCRLTSQEPADLLIPGQTEVRIKRLGSYLSGGQLDYVDPSVDGDAQVVTLKASGFLNLFGSRYTDTLRIFTATEATSIAAALITESQGRGADWDFGVTIGSLAIVGPHDRKYELKNIKDALHELTEVQTHPFDFEFMYDKVFNTYAAIGNNRPDIVFEYPNNIVSFRAPIDGTGIANRIIAQGQGLGDQASPPVVANDFPSQATYKVREKVLITNATDNSDNGLTDEAEAEKAAWSFPFQIPPIVVNGNVAPFVTDYGIGDYIRIRIKRYRLFSHIDSMYRLEKFDLLVDDDDNERVTVYPSI